MSFLKNIFSKNEQTKISHPQLGRLEYFSDSNDSYWELKEPWKDTRCSANFDFIALPGDENGPFEYSIPFFNSKKENLNSLWDLLQNPLKAVISDKFSEKEGEEPKEVFYLKSLTMDSEEKWDVGFQCNHRNAFVEFHMLGESVQGLDIDYE